MSRGLTLLAVAALSALTLTTQEAQAQAQAQERTVEMTVQVVDLACYVVHDLKGEEMHRECAQVCADQGVSLVLLGEDGTIYHPVGRAMPSSGDDLNRQLRPHAERTVRVRGTVLTRAGMNTIVMDNIQTTEER